MDVQSAAVHIERVPGALLSMRSELLCMESGYLPEGPRVSLSRMEALTAASLRSCGSSQTRD